MPRTCPWIAQLGLPVQERSTATGAAPAITIGSVADTTKSQLRPTGTRLAAGGTFLYFLEWVAILAAGGIDVFRAPGEASSKVVEAYAGHASDYGWAAGWFGVVLLGRVLFAVAVRYSLRRSGHDDPLADFGVLAVTAGVFFEVASYGVVATGALLADHGGSVDAVVMLDALGGSLNVLLWGATGVGVLALAAAMFRSGVFSRALCAVGGLGGLVLAVQGLAFAGANFEDLQSALQAAALLFWVWMIWTSVVLWRAPRVATAVTPD